eukprot:4733155-Pyramimonas_sp.AAC.1
MPGLPPPSEQQSIKFGGAASSACRAPAEMRGVAPQKHARASALCDGAASILQTAPRAPSRFAARAAAFLEQIFRAPMQSELS